MQSLTVVNKYVVPERTKRNLLSPFTVATAPEPTTETDTLL